MIFQDIFYLIRTGERIKTWYENHKDDEKFQKFAEGVKNAASNCVANYAETLDQSTWDNMVSKYDEATASMSEEDLQASADLANNFLTVIDSSENVTFENMEDSIRENPELWGQYLENAGVTEETVAQMQAKIDAGEDITNRDVFDVAVSGCSTAVTENLTATFSTEVQTPTAETQSAEAPEAPTEGSTTSAERNAAVDAEFSNITSGSQTQAVSSLTAECGA